jgi:hypothetical protein
MSKFKEALAQMPNATGLGTRIKKQLGDDSYRDLLVALGDRTIPVPAILNALRKLEVSVSRAVVMRWRNGEPPKGADLPTAANDNE